jgi:hypothetical protein
MDPVRRALFLLLFASVVMTEPTQSRAASPDRSSSPPTATARWIKHLAVALRRTVEPAASPPAWHGFRPAARSPISLNAQIAAAHPAREPHAFRLPPPTL